MPETVEERNDLMGRVQATLNWTNGFNHGAHFDNTRSCVVIYLSKPVEELGVAPDGVYRRDAFTLLVMRRLCKHCSCEWHAHQPPGEKCLFQSTEYAVDLNKKF